jgi:catechol 2,3-dioxygenase-like lactoylglutathione lyase family enzyme
MLDHITFGVVDFERSIAFYDKALAPLGVGKLGVFGREDTGGRMAGYGDAGRPWFWLLDRAVTSGPLHVAFAAPDRASVDAFYAAAIAAGGIDNGPPGVRAQYHPNYYGAFVMDPDGKNIEAVCRTG